MREPRLHILGFFALCIGSTQSVTCPQDQYTAQTQKYKVEFENDATWKFSEFAAYTQAPMLDRASSMLTKEELFDFLDNSGQTTFPVVGADEWTTVIDYENGDSPSYVRWYQVGTAGGSGYKSMSSWKTYSEGGSTGITALETNYNWLGYNFRWQATTCDGGGVSCHSKVVLPPNLDSVVYDFSDKHDLTTWKSYATSVAATTNVDASYTDSFEGFWRDNTNVGYLELTLPDEYDHFHVIWGSGGWVDGWGQYTGVQMCVCESGGGETDHCASASCTMVDSVDTKEQVKISQGTFVPGKVLRIQEVFASLPQHLTITLSSGCQSCPAGTISPVGSVSSDACVCQTDRYQETRLFPPADARTTCFPVDNNVGLSRSCDVTGKNYGNGVHALQFSSQYSTAYSPHTMFNSEDVSYGNDAAFANGQYNSAGIFVGSGQLNSDHPGDYITISMPTKVRVTRIEMYMQTYEYRDYTVFAKKYQVLGRNGVSESWQEIHEEMDAMNTLFYDPVKCTRGLDAGTDCMHKQEINTNYSFSQIAIVFETKQPSQYLYVALAELNIYGTSVETCTSCPTLSTSAAGSTSSDACKCQVNTYKQNITNTLTLHTDTGSHSWTEAETYAASQGGRLPTLDELSAYETKTGYFAARNVNEWIPVTNPGAPSGADYMMAYNGHGYSIGDSRWETAPSEGDPISSTFGQQDWVGVGQYPVWFSSDFACVQCPAGSTSPAGSISGDSCECAADSYKSGGECSACPSGMTSPAGSTSIDDCISTCTSGTYLFTIPDIEWQFRGGNSWGSLQQHEFVQAGVALGYQSRYLTKEEMTAWMSANGNSLPSTYQSWVWVSPGQSKTYGFWSMWTNTFHPYAPYEHDGTFGGSLDMGDGYFFRRNQPGTLCKTCSVGQVTSGDGAVSVDACICAANSYATSDEEMLTYTDSNFYVSSGQGLDQNTVYYETTNNGFALEFHHWDEKTFWANGYVLFSYDGVYNTKTHNLAEVRIKNLVPGAEYKINLFHYLQTGWQHVGHHQGEFMFSVNGGSLQRFDTLEMPSSGVPPPTTVLTVAAKDDGTISLLFTRDMQKDAGGRFKADCAVFNPPLRNCNAAGRHLVLSGLSIAPVCASCPGEMTSPAGSTSIDACACPVNTYGPHGPLDGLVGMFGLDGDVIDEIGDAIIETYSGAVSFVLDGVRGQVLDNGVGALAINSAALANLVDQDEWTVTMWVYQTSTSSYTHLINRYDKNTRTSGSSVLRGGFAAYVTGNRVYVERQDNSGNSVHTCQTDDNALGTLSLNSWHHISLISRATSLEIYIDGQSAKISTLQAGRHWERTHDDTVKKIGFGLYCTDTVTAAQDCYTHASVSKNGLRQDLRFYNRALTSAEITALAARTGQEANVCASCPSGLTSPAGSTSIDACECTANKFKQNPAVSLFRLDGDFDDEVGTASIHKIGGTAATFVSDPARGSALNVDSMLYKIESPTMGSILDSSTFTISVWMSFQDLTPDSLLLSRYDTSGGDDRGGFIFWVKSKKLVLQQYYGPSSTPYLIESNSELSVTNQWYHIALVKKSDAEIQFFIDGTMDKSFSMSPAAKSMRSPISFVGVGSYCSTSTTTETGYICYTATSYLDNANFYAQDLHFYDYALSAAEIAYLKTGYQLQCSSCPDGMTSLVGSTTIDACACPVNTYGPHGPLNGLVGMFGLNGDIDDEVGTASIQMYSGTATFAQDADRGQVLDNGATQMYIESTVLSDALDQDAWSISLWFKASSWTTFLHIANRYDITTGANGQRGGVSFGLLNTGKFYLQRQREGGNYWINCQGSTTITANTWYHVVAISEPRNLKVYLNGNVGTADCDVSSTTDWAHTQIDLPPKIGLGLYCVDNDSMANDCYVHSSATNAGYRQDLRFYNRALTSAEITALAARTGQEANVCASCPSGLTSPALSTSISACACADNQQTVAFKNDKLQAWYKLESDGLDSGPHAAHLQTRLSATANFVSGQYLSVSDDVSFLIPRDKTGLIIPAGTTELTVSFWVKNWIDGYVMRWVESNLFFWENSDASKDGEASIEGSTLKTLFTKSSEWTHMLFVFDQTQIVFYENGVFKDHSTTAKIPAGGFVQETDKDAGLFCNPYSSSMAHDFRGDVKDIRFYLAAFTSAEARALYAGVGSCVGESEESTPVSTCCYKTWPE